MAVHELNQHSSLEGMLDGTAPAAARFTWAARLGLAQGLAKALAYLHQVGTALQLLHVTSGQGACKAVWRADWQSAGHMILLAGPLPRYSETACCYKSQCAEVKPKPVSKATF